MRSSANQILLIFIVNVFSKILIPLLNSQLLVLFKDHFGGFDILNLNTLVLNKNNALWQNIKLRLSIGILHMHMNRFMFPRIEKNRIPNILKISGIILNF